MSRGPGKWQRSIVQALTGHQPAVWMRDLLPLDYSAAEYQALYRASRRLNQQGVIAIWTSRFSHSQLILAKPGFQVTRSEVPRLKVEPVPRPNHLNTYEHDEGVQSSDSLGIKYGFDSSLVTALIESRTEPNSEL